MDNDNKLRKVKDEARIVSLLTGSKQSEADAYVWKLIGSTKHLGQVKIEAIRKSRNDFCIIPSSGQERIVQDLIVGQTYIDLYLPESVVLLRCNVKSTNAPSRYYLEIPAFIAQVERRKSFRLNVHELTAVRINFEKTIEAPRIMSQHFSKDCYDISTGGFSFFISRMESKYFQINNILPSVEIKIGNWSGKAEAQILAIRKAAPDEYKGLSYTAWRVSCCFTKLDQAELKYLERFIFERIKSELHAINK